MRRVMLAMTFMILCACSSGGSSDLALGPTVPTTAAVATTAAPTTAVPPTESPVVTEPTTTVAATPLTPVTDAPTTAPVASKEDQVRTDFEAARLARAQCTIEPLMCDYASIAVPGSPMDVQTHEVVTQRVTDNVRGKRGFGDTQVKVESVGFDGASAFLTICVYDTVVLFDIQDSANAEDDIIVNDVKASYRVRWEVRQDGGRWLMYEGISLQHLTDGNLCA